jgi:V8-like Glu-specific endopeptidase
MDGAEVMMKKMDGTPITAGKVYNGDGALVTLGYFDQGSTANPFAGNWIPLTTGTKFGDSSTGYGYPDGHFFATSIFSKILMWLRSIHPNRPIMKHLPHIL